MDPDENTGPVIPYTPGWKDAHGIVHISGTHSYMAVFAECGITIAVGGSPSRTYPQYEDTVEAPTCIMCIGLNSRM